MISTVVAFWAIAALSSASGATRGPTLADKVAGGWARAGRAPPVTQAASDAPAAPIAPTPPAEPMLVSALVVSTLVAVLVVWAAVRRGRPRLPG